MSPEESEYTLDACSSKTEKTSKRRDRGSWRFSSLALGGLVLPFYDPLPSPSRYTIPNPATPKGSVVRDLPRQRLA